MMRNSPTKHVSSAKASAPSASSGSSSATDPKFPNPVDFSVPVDSSAASSRPDAGNGFCSVFICFSSALCLSLIDLMLATMSFCESLSMSRMSMTGSRSSSAGATILSRSTTVRFGSWFFDHHGPNRTVDFLHKSTPNAAAGQPSLVSGLVGSSFWCSPVWFQIFRFRFETLVRV